MYTKEKETEVKYTPSNTQRPLTSFMGRGLYGGSPA